MEELNQFLNTPLLQFANTSITLGKILEVATLVLAGIVFILWSTGFLRSRLSRRSINADLVHMVTRAYLIVGFIILAFITLDLLQVPLTAFAFVSGAVAIGFGFGAQNIINNFISGWILMWERPIKIGDYLEMGEVRGTVESINTRSTRIRRLDGVHLLVPNSFLLENTVINWTLMDKLVRTTVVVGVAYGSDVRLTTRLLEQAAEENPRVLQQPSRQVIFDDFGDSALVFVLNVWTHGSSERDLRLLRSELRYRIDELFRDNDVVISFPQRDVHLDGELRLVNDRA